MGHSNRNWTCLYYKSNIMLSSSHKTSHSAYHHPPISSVNTNATAQIWTSRNRYSYNWQNVLVYGIGIAVALFSVIIDLFSFLANGCSASTSFSRILLTTRNPNIKLLAEGRCLLSLPLRKELGKVKLQCGLLKAGAEESEHEPAAFGYAETVTELRKGACM